MIKLNSIILVLTLTAALGSAALFAAADTAPKKENRMSGIVFFATQKPAELKKFYIEEVGCMLWMDQGDCVILRHGNFLFGFCTRDRIDTCGMITFFYETRGDVDRMYRIFKERAEAAPRENPKYPIYHFFAKDPEGRAVEFQYFTCPIDWQF